MIALMVCSVKSSSRRKLRPCRLNAIWSRLSFQWAAHAARSAPATAEFVAADGDDLDAVLAEVVVGGGVALVRHDHARLQGEHIAPVVPLLALGGEHVLGGDQDLDVIQSDRPADG